MSQCVCVQSVKISTQQRREEAISKPAVESCDNHMTQRPAITKPVAESCDNHVTQHPAAATEKSEGVSVNGCSAEHGEGGGREGGGGGEGEVEGEENTVTSEVVRKFQQQLEEIKVAPRETRRRKSRRLQQQEPEATAPPPQTNPSLSLHRRSRRNRKRSEVLTDSQIPDSQVLQV